jgi:CspA family cold shock protein
MPIGTVKWFNPSAGYGFIEPDDGSGFAFVHKVAIENADLKVLVEGQKVRYDRVPGMDGKDAAENIVILD